ncbi:AP-2 complex subunit mu-like isoform X1 [Gossypium australe]|uniref:AP-2 complex subunit mu-like isoform X1 n=1 Tax=Gossypium australe TaxID=47621 RepID=A0A5B6VJH3_9ROSI|nr:AP-2 complex subunit mu-like isoform X1 [Gossypium australe]
MFICHSFVFLLVKVAVGKTIKLDNVTFHQYVNLTRFKSEKTVSFVPPDGDFELMKYCFTEGVSLPFQILPTIEELGQTLMQVNVKVKSVFGVKMFALVVIRIPVPKQTVKQVSKSHQDEQSIMLYIDSLLWKIRKFPGQTKPTLSAEVELISMMAEKRSWMRPPIQMEFEIPFYPSKIAEFSWDIDTLPCFCKTRVLMPSGERNTDETYPKISSQFPMFTASVWEKSGLAILPRAGLAHMRSGASSLG